MSSPYSFYFIIKNVGARTTYWLAMTCFLHVLALTFFLLFLHPNCLSLQSNINKLRDSLGSPNVNNTYSKLAVMVDTYTKFSIGQDHSTRCASVRALQKLKFYHK